MTDTRIIAPVQPRRRERPFWLAVQWHPEYGEDYGLFLGLVTACRPEVASTPGR